MIETEQASLYFGHRDTNTCVSLSGKENMRSDILLGSNRLIVMIIPGSCAVAVKVNSTATISYLPFMISTSLLRSTGVYCNWILWLRNDHD